MRVMTLNIWNYTEPWVVRKELITELIVDHQPDVIALQETRHDFRVEKGRGQAEQIAAATGYRSTSRIAQVYIPILRVDEGLAILTRETPTRTVCSALTRLRREREDENRRIVLGARIKSGAHVVDVYCSHFSLSARARVSNAREVVGVVDRESGREAAIVMGDFNAEPEEESVRTLIDAGFTDCWTAVHREAFGYTYASWGGVRRIDYILARGISGVESAWLVGSQRRLGAYASDHLGIVADLTV